MEESASGKVNKKKLFYILTAVWWVIIIAIFGSEVPDDYDSWLDSYLGQTARLQRSQYEQDWNACADENPLARENDRYKTCMTNARKTNDEISRRNNSSICRRTTSQPCTFVYDWKDDAEIQKYLRENKFKDRDEYPTYAKTYLIRVERDKRRLLDYLQSRRSESFRYMIFFLVVGTLIFAYGERLAKKFKSWITS